MTQRWNGLRSAVPWEIDTLDTLVLDRGTRTCPGADDSRASRLVVALVG